MRRTGFTVAEADTGLETLRLALETKPDLILVNGPFGSDAPDVLGQLKANPATQNIPLILICAPRVARHASSEHLADSWLSEAGASKTLLPVIQLLLRARSAERERDEINRQLWRARELTAESNRLAVLLEILIHDALGLRAPADSAPEVFFIVDSSGCLRYVSKNGSEYTGTRLKDFAWEAVLYPEDTHRVKSAISENFRTGSPISIAFRARSVEGIYRRRHFYCWPVTVGGNLYWFGFISDSDDVMHPNQTHEGLIEGLKGSINRLARSDPDMNRYAAIVAHALLSPLSTISSVSTFIYEEYGDRLGACGCEYLSLLLKSIERMRTVVEMYRKAEADMIAPSIGRPSA